MDGPKPKSNTTWPIELVSERGVVLDAILRNVAVETTEAKNRLRTTIAFTLKSEGSIRNGVTHDCESLHGTMQLRFWGGHGEIDAALFRRWKVRLGLHAKLDESESGHD